MSEPQQYSISDVSFGSFWYCRIEEKEIGPLSTGRLRQLAKQAKLFPEDHVRLGSIGDWVPASEVAGLFRGIKTMTRAEQQDAAARDTAKQSSVIDRSAVSAGTWDTINDWTTEAVNFGVRSFGLLRVVISWVCLVVVVVTLAILIGRNVSLDVWPSRVDAYQTLTRSWDGLQSLRDSAASEQEWTDFAASSDAELAPIIAELERKAGAHDRYSQQILWAARDCWPDMLTGARQNPNDAERRFESHLANAQSLSDGRPLYPSAERTGGPAAFDSNIFLRIYGDWLVAGMVLIDGLLILLLIRWLWRRSRNR